MADDCTCQPCKDRRWVVAWAEGEKVPRPPIDLVKHVVRALARSYEMRTLVRVEYDGRDDLH